MDRNFIPSHNRLFIIWLSSLIAILHPLFRISYFNAPLHLFQENWCGHVFQDRRGNVYLSFSHIWTNMVHHRKRIWIIWISLIQIRHSVSKLDIDDFVKKKSLKWNSYWYTIFDVFNKLVEINKMLFFRLYISLMIMCCFNNLKISVFFILYICLHLLFSLTSFILWMSYYVWIFL